MLVLLHWSSLVHPPHRVLILQLCFSSQMWSTTQTLSARCAWLSSSSRKRRAWNMLRPTRHGWVQTYGLIWCRNFLRRNLSAGGLCRSFCSEQGWNLAFQIVCGNDHNVRPDWPGVLGKKQRVAHCKLQSLLSWVLCIFALWNQSQHFDFSLCRCFCSSDGCRLAVLHHGGSRNVTLGLPKDAYPLCAAFGAHPRLGWFDCQELRLMLSAFILLNSCNFPQAYDYIEYFSGEGRVSAALWKAGPALFIYIYWYKYTYLSTYLPIYLSICLSIYLSVYLSIFLSFYLFIS